MTFKHRTKETRVLVSAGLGVAVALLVGLVLRHWALAPLIGWDVAAATLLLGWWWVLRKADPAQTARFARYEDSSHGVWDVVLTVAAIASLGAVGVLLTSKSIQGGPLTIGLALASIVLSWAVVHTVYAIHYAALYYQDGKGGVDFNGDEDPDFRDFVYLAITLGMTYQVSDTNLQTKQYRRAATHHALLSFLFGTAIIATTINFVASLVG